MKLRKTRIPRGEAPNVVASVARQTAEAAALADIQGQHRLADPTTNPAVRPHADRLRDAEQVKALDNAHSRTLRRYRVADRRAADAEKTLEVLRAAQQMSSPARSVLALHRGRTRFLGLSMAASLTLSVGSATGPGDLAAKYTGHSFVGWIAEIGLTGLSTMAIMYRSHLGEHGTPLKRGSGQDKALWALTIVPLVAGIVANLVAHGVVGVFCAVGAAAFATLAHLIADQSNAALRARAGEVDAVDEARLRAVAMGEDPHATPTAEPEPQGGFDEPMRIPPEMREKLIESLLADDLAEEQQPAEVAELFSNEALARWLNEPPEEGPTPTGSHTDDDGPTGAAKQLPKAAGDLGIRGSHIDTEQHGDEETPPAPDRPKSRVSNRGPGRVSRRVDPAIEARRAVGEETRRRVAEYQAAHPDHTVEQICAALKLGRATVMRARKALRETR